MVTTDRLREELAKAKETVRGLKPSRAADDLNRYIDLIEKRVGRE